MADDRGSTDKIQFQSPGAFPSQRDFDKARELLETYLLRVPLDPATAGTPLTARDRAWQLLQMQPEQIEAAFSPSMRRIMDRIMKGVKQDMPLGPYLVDALEGILTYSPDADPIVRASYVQSDRPDLKSKAAVQVPKKPGLAIGRATWPTLQPPSAS